MGRKSSISRMPPKAKRRVQQLIREDRHTLDEMIEILEREFPSEAPSRSALHRYRVSAEQMAQRMREIDQVAEVLVSELGENPNEKAGQLLVQAVTTATVDVALRAQDSDEPMDVKSVGQLARAARNVMEARQRSQKERMEIERLAREQQLEEQKTRLESVAKKRGMTAEAAETIRREILGVKS